MAGGTRRRVLRVEAWTTIRYLHAQGTPIRAICRELGVSRKVVRRALRREGPPKYERPSKPNPKLAPFEAQIRIWYFGEKLIGSRILRELQARGYDGHRSALYRYLAKLKAETPSSRVTERFETPPGQQAQFDWSPYTVELGGELTRVVVFGMVLGYSRRKHYTASLDETQASIYEAIESCLRHFGGYVGDPCQEASSCLSSTRARSPSKMRCRPTCPFAAASSRCLVRIGVNSGVVTK